MGTTPRQRLLRLRLPLALPEILLGINQTILLAVSMLVITALVGTRDLGQEVYIALTKADVGRGIVAGLGVAIHRHDRRPHDDRPPPHAHGAEASALVHGACVSALTRHVATPPMTPRTRR